MDGEGVEVIAEENFPLINPDELARTKKALLSQLQHDRTMIVVMANKHSIEAIALVLTTIIFVFLMKSFGCFLFCFSFSFPLSSLLVLLLSLILISDAESRVLQYCNSDLKD